MSKGFGRENQNVSKRGFHYYQLNVDGASVPDPGTKYFYGAGRWGSGIEIPAHDEDFYALKDVPHGLVSELNYYSKITQLADITLYTASAQVEPKGSFVSLLCLLDYIVAQIVQRTPEESMSIGTRIEKYLKENYLLDY